MTELEIKIMKFLLSAAVYSENAIIKNFGINKDILKNIFSSLEEKGYLESYDEFMKREGLNEEGECCKSKKHTSCSSCKSFSHCSSLTSSCCSNNMFSDIEDFSKIKVLTEKAIEEFY